MFNNGIQQRQLNHRSISWKNYLKEWRETNQAMKNFLSTEITFEADMLSEQEISSDSMTAVMIIILQIDHV